MLRPLNHLAMLRVTATPAISEPSPNTMHPAQATLSDCAAGSPESSAQVTIPAPATISPTKIEPVMRTPQRSSSMPHSTSPPKMQSIEYPEVYLPYSSCPQPSCNEPGSLKMFETVLNMSSKKYDPNMGTTSSARAIQAAALPVILNFPVIKRIWTPITRRPPPSFRQPLPSLCSAPQVRDASLHPGPSGTRPPAGRPRRSMRR